MFSLRRNGVTQYTRLGFYALKFLKRRIERYIPVAGQRRVGPAAQASRRPRGRGRRRHHRRAAIEEYPRLRQLHGVAHPGEQPAESVVRRVLAGSVQLHPAKEPRDGGPRAKSRTEDQQSEHLRLHAQAERGERLRAGVQGAIRRGRGLRFCPRAQQAAPGSLRPRRGHVLVDVQLRSRRVL